MTLLGLERAYMRRKRWEARMLAFEVARAFVGDGEAVSGDGAMAERVVSQSGKVYRRVSPDALMAQMGAKWQ